MLTNNKVREFIVWIARNGQMGVRWLDEDKEYVHSPECEYIHVKECIDDPSATSLSPQ